VGKHKGGGNEGVCTGYILYPYENRRMKPVEIVLRKGKEEKENDGGGKSN
jgi:hypothetical protein